MNYKEIAGLTFGMAISYLINFFITIIFFDQYIYGAPITHWPVSPDNISLIIILLCLFFLFRKRIFVSAGILSVIIVTVAQIIGNLSVYLLRFIQ